MTSRMKPSLRNLVLLGALLLLAATVTGCGVSLPTQPDVIPNSGEARTATGSGAEAPGEELEMGDLSPTLADAGTSLGTPPAPEVIVPTPGSSGNGWKYGHAKRWRNKK